VRIALNLKGLRVEHVAHHRRRGEQRAQPYLQINPQGLVPALELGSDGEVLTQSLAICGSSGLVSWITCACMAISGQAPCDRARAEACSPQRERLEDAGALLLAGWVGIGAIAVELAGARCQRF